MTRLNLEVIFGARDKLSPALKAMVGGSKLATAELKKAKDAIRQLDATQVNIDGYRKLRTELDQTNDEITRHKNIITDLKRSADLDPLTKSQTQELDKSQKSLEKLNTTYDKQSRKLTESVQGLHKAGVSVSSLAEDEAKLKDKVVQTTLAYEKQKKALENINAAQKSYQDTQAKLHSIRSTATKGLMIAGAGAAAMSVPVREYAQAEDAQMTLRVSMMTNTGEVDKSFNDIYALANRLGTKLPGTTADFQNMMSVLIQQGIGYKAILGGVGEAAGYLGVQLKMPFADAAEFAAKMQDATKTAEKDMLGLMDTIQRSYYLGVDSTNMLSGFSKISAGMKTIKLEGLEGAKAMAPLLIMADQASMAGESAGNAYSKIFKSMMDTANIQKALKKSGTGLSMNFTDGNGEFGGMDNMFKQLEKLKGLSTEQRLPILSGMFGNDAETIQALNLLIDKGQAGYKETIAKMQAQADLQTRVNAQLSTLTNLWDAAKGTFSSVMASFGELIAPELKAMTTWLTSVADGINTWVKANPTLAATLAKVAVGAIALVGGVSALAIGLTTILGPLALLKMTLVTMSGGVGIFNGLLKALIFPIKAVGMAFLWVGRAMLANPMVLAITAIVAVVAGAAYLIYKNWTPIKEFFVNLWAKVGSAFQSGVNWIKGIIQSVDNVFANNPVLTFLIPLIGIPRLIIANWSSITGFFAEVWSSITSGASNLWMSITTLFAPMGQWFGEQWVQVKSIASDTWASVSSSASGAWNSISTVFSPVGSWFAARWGDIKTAFGGGISSVSALIMNWSPIGLFYSVFAKVLSWFGVELPAKFSGFGTMIIDGLVAGITSRFEKLKSVWATVNNYMPDFMRKKMEIRSPSRVFRELGGYVMQGWQIGIADGIAPLQSVFNKALGVMDAPQLAMPNGVPTDVLVEPKVIQKPVTTRAASNRVIEIQGDQITIQINQTPGQSTANLMQDVRAELMRFEREKMARLRTSMVDED